ncbi:NB-ARC domain-containing protein [Streptomyces sp. XM4193]|uniref:AfsR/SARP family transcriptional regulator n=1 Tax=Streptomyces sp. XM4193 TaxID=2929782 RepID=UPI001FF94CCD|nr:AfsR/SARP family transcriptional regulator [Streptomyces sp. XM4193]MCK1798973.1 NB-ARC domain-containing protein [Streptomyces sp. XM4193]
MPGLGFDVLGEVRAYRDGTELPRLGAPQQQSTLLVLLLLAGHAVSMSQLVRALWGEEPPAAAVRSIRTHIWRLRGLLGSDGAPARELVSVGDGYRLDIDASAVDANRAESALKKAARLRLAGQSDAAGDTLDEALQLWRGDPLAGVPGPFAERQRDRLSELRLTMVEEHLELDIARGRHQMTILRLRELADAYPLRERLHGLLMRALYAAGRQADALAVFGATRTLLVEEYGLEPGPQLTELHQRILQGDLRLATVTETAAPVPPGPDRLVPAQLPPDLPDFTGRRSEVDELCELLTRSPGSAPPVVSLTGMSGMGKSALAVHVAHRVREAYPDGQLFCGLRGTGDRPARSGEVLAGFLSALGVDAVPAGTAARCRMFRSLLDGRKMLLVLDDARDADQVRDLLPGSPSCAVLVTHRARLAGLPLSRQLGLRAFGPHDSLELLGRTLGRQRIDREPAQASLLADACGGLPLALRILASRLAARPDWPLAAMGERLGDERRTVAELQVGGLAVRGALEPGYRRLPPVQARALRLLATGTSERITVSAAAAVLHADRFEAEDVLEALVDAALLETSTPGSYTMHPLVRCFARHHARAEAAAKLRTAPAVSPASRRAGLATILPK